MNTKTAKLLRAYNRLTPSRLSERQMHALWAKMSPELRARATQEMRNALKLSGKRKAA